MKARYILEGLGASLLLFTVFDVLSSDVPVYEHPLPVTNLVGGFLIGMIVVAVLVALILWGVDQLPQTPRRTLLSLFAGFMIWRVLDTVISFINSSADQLNHRIYFWEPIRYPVCLFILAVSLACAWIAPRFATQAIDYTRLVVSACAFASLVIVPHMLHSMGLRQSPTGTMAVNQAPGLPGTTGNRIVWILFDELSYDQAFDHPQAGINLPAFDHLRDASFNFSNIRPAGYFTERIIPSLFLGQQIENTRRTPEGALFYKTRDQKQWVRFNPSETIFGTARAEGWTTGLVGWLNPYCRIMGSVLDSCFWSRNDSSMLEPYGASEDNSMLHNAAIIPLWALTTIKGGMHEYPAEHLANYETNMIHAKLLIDDSRMRFIFIHLPIPHPPGIFDRKSNRTRADGSYLDNLSLADQAAASLLSEIAATPAAAHTTLIVSSDHSLRIALWKADGRAWTAEDEAATGGRFDDRPVLLIHFPGQTAGETIPASFDEMEEHDIFDAMLRGQVKTPEEFAGFLVKLGVATAGAMPTQVSR